MNNKIKNIHKLFPPYKVNQVFSPTMPSAVKPWFFYQAITAASVAAPNTPSGFLIPK